MQWYEHGPTIPVDIWNADGLLPAKQVRDAQHILDRDTEDCVLAMVEVQKLLKLN